LAEIAAEFVRLRVDVILATGTAPALVAKRATAVIPVVFAFAGDPLGTGPVVSLTRPGGNITGLSRTRRLILTASELSYYARSSLICAYWGYWPMPIIPLRCWR
jgi:ABC-type uncharacterized transport system substrate-binding protein